MSTGETQHGVGMIINIVVYCHGHTIQDETSTFRKN